MTDPNSKEHAPDERGHELLALLKAEKERAEAASLAKSQFLATMSHELRTPLSAILGYAHILKMSGGLDARQQRSVEAMHESGEYLLRLINDILDIARIETGKTQLVPSAASLPTLLRFVSHVIGVRAKPKGLRYVCEPDGSLPSAVMVDERRLSQVLLNLLGNAVKFTASGQVTLRVRRLPGDGPAALVRFEVEDTGRGIARDDLRTIFEPFEQVGPRHERVGGAGLGLAISRRIVQLMGSDIEVQSKVGRGSRFWFDLLLPPAQVHAAPMENPRERIAGYEGPRKTVLIVDDVAADRDIADGVLCFAGFRTLQASDGREALEMLRAQEADLVIMDVAMPVMGGVQTVQAIRKMPRFAALPIIAVSARSYESDRQRALQAGADAFLPKPLDFNRLFDEVGARLRLTWVWAQS